MDLTIRTSRLVASVEPAAWNGLDHGTSPFLEYGFLRALESSGSVGGTSGWNPYYLLAEGVADGATGADVPAGPLLGAVACFHKQHSYGEYIFDFGWARASEKAGIPYYPKLVVAAPFTPATGPRLLLRRDLDASGRKAVATRLVEGVLQLCDALECSSVHFLFTTREEHELLAELGFLPRASFQFHWHNRGYGSFDDFLATLSSRKRKQIRKERERARAEVDDISFIDGNQISTADLRALDDFYRSTTDRHGGHDYLRPGFFEALVQHHADRVRFCRVMRAGAITAGALFLETPQALYGRYWGSREETAYLHFETAYYQGIERAIARGMPLFEAGAQGEHKLLRGFEPSPTYSSHFIRHEGLRHAIERFVADEAEALPPYMAELHRFTPYKRGS